MAKFGIGDFLSLSDGQNIYEVIATNPHKNGCYYHLQCKQYCDFEDLGDGIRIYGFEHCVWITNFFDYKFKLFS